MKKLTLLLLLAAPLRADFNSLNLGVDDRVRYISISNNKMANQDKESLSYYSQSTRAYMTAWLNEDVEAAFRAQSISLWGLEGTNTLPTTYPKADGTPWVEEAYVHMPNLAWKHLNLIIGRQPITLGDGMIVSSDDKGFDAIRAQLKGPWKTELDVFTAKIAGTTAAPDVSDLKAAVFRAQQAERNWDLGIIQETHGAGEDYHLGLSTYTTVRVQRRFYDARLFGDLKDAYYKIEIAMQQGDAVLAPDMKVKLKGLGERLELGAQKDTDKWGRFGVKALYAQGTGDDNGTGTTDEAFRPSFCHRWDGLQRSGFGDHFAATLSDVYDPSAPFAPGTTGLPPGFSGVRTMSLGIFSTQKVFWTGSLDYFTYQALTKPTGLADLGAEVDLGITYRYTGFVTFRLGEDLFFPGNVYKNYIPGGTSRVMRTTFEAHVHF